MSIRHLSLLLSGLLLSPMILSCQRGHDVTTLPTSFSPVTQQATTDERFDSQNASMRYAAVGLKSGVDIQSLGGVINIVESYQALQAIKIRVPNSEKMSTYLKQLRSDKRVLWAEPIYRYQRDYSRVKVQPVKSMKTQVSPQFNDPLYIQQYGLQSIQAPQAWLYTQGSPTIKLAVLDGGLDLNHPEFQDKIVDPYNVWDKAAQPIDDDGYGTFVSGVATAISGNGEGIIGVAPKVSLMPIKVLNHGGGHSDHFSAGILWAVQHGAKVILMDFAYGWRSRLTEIAMQYALDRNVTIIAPLGNFKKFTDHEKNPYHPATYPGAIGVGALDERNVQAPFTNYGNGLSVMAPGVDVVSTMPTYYTSNHTPLNYGVVSGTEASAAHVAGIAALMLSRNPGLTPTQVKSKLESTAVDLGLSGRDDDFGHGLANAFQALAQ